MILTQSRLCTLHFNENKILKITRALNIRKAHGYYDISITMIQICDRFKPLIILFKILVEYLCYPDIWNRSNINLYIKKWQTIT